MALYRAKDTDVADKALDPVLLTFRLLNEVVADSDEDPQLEIVAATGVESPIECLSNIFDECGVCDGDGSSCSTTSTAVADSNHHTIIFATMVAFSFLILVALIFAASRRRDSRDRPRAQRQSYELV